MTQKFGRIAIIGRPNVGKSTLMNALLGEKLSIVTRKPQTTREQILGIKTIGDVQAVYIDTPGLHKNTYGQFANRMMNRAASSALAGADIIVFLTSGLEWQQEEEWILEKLKDVTVPVVLAINKMDLIKNKETLYAWVKEKSECYAFHAIVPLSAKNQSNVAALEKELMPLLPEGPHFYELDDLTDKSDQFRVTEIIREKVMRLTGQEIPYVAEYEIQEYRQEGKMLRVQAIVWLAKSGQKAIVIGQGGERLKAISTQAREELEKCFHQKVFLRLHVKVRKS